MHEWITHLEAFFHAYGVWAVFIVLLLENAGLPVPGEATLLYASFLAHQHRGLTLPGLILAGTAACILGDNLGYWIGREAGLWIRRVLRLTHERMVYVEHYFRRYGSWTIFFARFVTGLRIIAGPAAGLYRMPWPEFLLFNAMGAAAWVCTISGAGYLLGHQWQHLVKLMGRIDLVLLVVAAVVILLVLRRLKQEKAESSR